MNDPIVLSYVQTEPLLAARREVRQSVVTSLDLGITTTEVTLGREGVVFPGGVCLGWSEITTIATSKTVCFLVVDGDIREIRSYSELTGRVYSLMPTRLAPTLLVSGIPMHRIKGTDPWSDTKAKIATIAPVVGRVLDTATGLGYTAIQAAWTAEQVVTVELDPAVLEIARLNPWSKALFADTKISQRIGNSFELIQEFRDGVFSRVIHDPPTLSLAGELYSERFYQELFRVLHRGGRLFHYVGNPASRSGQTLTAGVLRRLREAGFSRVSRRPEAFGVVAFR